jgi:hypothetical protein
LCSPMGDGHFFCRGDAAFAHWGRSLLARGGHFFRKSLGPRKRIPVGRSLSGDGHFFDKFWGPRKWILRGGHFQGTVTFGGPLGPRKIDSVGRSLSGDGHFFDNLWGPGNAFLWDGHFQGTVTFLTVRTRHPGSRRVPPTDEFGQKEQCPFCDKLCDRGINTPAGAAAPPAGPIPACALWSEGHFGNLPRAQNLSLSHWHSLGPQNYTSLKRVCRYLCRNLGFVDISVAI